jgi:hypothetical protein
MSLCEYNNARCNQKRKNDVDPVSSKKFVTIVLIYPRRSTDIFPYEPRRLNVTPLATLGTSADDDIQQLILVTVFDVSFASCICRQFP